MKKSIIIIFLLFLACKYLYADIIFLHDGTILIGKAIKKTSYKLIFASSYGTFTIKVKNVKKLYKTKTYNDDIKIIAQLGKKMDQVQIDKIKKDFLAGEKYKIKYEKEKKKKFEQSDLWNFHRLSFFFDYAKTLPPNNPDTRSITEVMIHGLKFTLSYDYGFEKFLKKRVMYIPGIRIDTAFALYTNDYSHFQTNIYAFILGAGPMWIMPSFTNSWGYFILAFIPGIVIQKAESQVKKVSTVVSNFTMSSYLGYGYRFRRVNVQALFKYDFIDDPYVAFHAIGFSLGVSYVFF